MSVESCDQKRSPSIQELHTGHQVSKGHQIFEFNNVCAKRCGNFKFLVL